MGRAIEKVDITQGLQTIQKNPKLSDKIAIYPELESFGGIPLDVLVKSRVDAVR